MVFWFYLLDHKHFFSWTEEILFAAEDLVVVRNFNGSLHATGGSGALSHMLSKGTFLEYFLIFWNGGSIIYLYYHISQSYNKKKSFWDVWLFDVIKHVLHGIWCKLHIAWFFNIYLHLPFFEWNFSLLSTRYSFKSDKWSTQKILLPV